MNLSRRVMESPAKQMVMSRVSRTVAAPSAVITLPEWGKADPSTDVQLAHRVLDSDPAVRIAARSLSQNKVLDVLELRDGLRIQTFSFVGVLALGSLQISIIP